MWCKVNTHKVSKWNNNIDCKKTLTQSLHIETEKKNWKHEREKLHIDNMLRNTYCWHGKLVAVVWRDFLSPDSFIHCYIYVFSVYIQFSIFNGYWIGFYPFKKLFIENFNAKRDKDFNSNWFHKQVSVLYFIW